MDIQKEGCRELVRRVPACGCVAQGATVPALQFSPGSVSILPCSQTQCLLHVQNSGTWLRAPCLRNQGVILGLCWGGLVCCRDRSGTGACGLLQGRWELHWEKETDTARRYSWAGLYLTQREHFWCFTDIQHLERLLNADLYEVSNNLFLPALHAHDTGAGYPPMIEPNPIMSHY